MESTNKQSPEPKNKNNSEGSENNKRDKTIVYIVLAILASIATYLIYMNPYVFMTNEAKTLTGKELVDAENAARTNAFSVVGGMLVIGTLWVNLGQLKLAKNKFEKEKEKEWRTQVENLYGEWTGIFLSQTKIGIKLARAKSLNFTDEINRLQAIFDDYSFQRLKIQFKILMLEQRQPVIKYFKKINEYTLPHDPLLKISDEAVKNPKINWGLIRTFWDDLADKDGGETVNFFHECTQKTLAEFCEYISNYNAEAKNKNMDDYVDRAFYVDRVFGGYINYVKMKNPNIEKLINDIKTPKIVAASS